MKLDTCLKLLIAPLDAVISSCAKLVVNRVVLNTSVICCLSVLPFLLLSGNLGGVLKLLVISGDVIFIVFTFFLVWWVSL